MTNEWTLSDDAKARIPEWNERWSRIILSTDPIDFHRTAEAVRGMYRAANLDDRIPIIPVMSPMMAAIVGCCAAVYWRLHAAAHAATAAATYVATAAATRAATRAATDAATRDATAAATYDATDAATYVATSATTHAATYAATHAATYAATDAATYAATDAATHDATTKIAEMILQIASSVVSDKLGRNVFDECEKESETWYKYYNGGSEWAAWCCYLSFVRDVVGWKHSSHANYSHYEQAAIHGGPRFMHRRFCLLSERAAVRHMDDRMRLHCEDGPAISWRCGTARWYIHGVAVDEQIVMRPESQNVEQIDIEENADVRNVRVQRFGWPRYLRESGCRVIDGRVHPRDMLQETLYSDKDGRHRFVAIDPATNEPVSMLVPRECVTCEQAQQFITHGADATAMCRT